MPSVFGVTMVKNEDDILDYTLKEMYKNVDHIIAYDNMSDDNTRDILESYGSDITVLDDYEVGYHQARKMTKLTHMAGERGATHTSSRSTLMRCGSSTLTSGIGMRVSSS